MNRTLLACLTVIMVGLCFMLIGTLRSPLESDRPVRIAVNNWPGYDSLYLAEEKGYFADEGLNLEIVPVNALTDIHTAYERGLVDGFTGTLVDVAETIQEGHLPVRIVLLADYSKGDMVLARPGISTTADLKGQRLALELTSSLGRYMAARTLESASLTVADVTLRSFGQSYMLNTIRRKEADAVITYIPYVNTILQETAKTPDPWHPIFSSAQMPGEIVDLVAVTPAVLERYPHFAASIQRAWQRALSESAAHPEETRKFMAARYRITPEEYGEMKSVFEPLDVSAMHVAVRSGQLHTTLVSIAAVLNPAKPISRQQATRAFAVIPGDRP